MTNRIRRTSGACLVALAAACSPPDADRAGPPDARGSSQVSDSGVTAAAEQLPAPAQYSYRAVGTEPFWGLDITTDGLRFSTPENIDGTRFPPAAPVAAGDTLTWRTGMGTGAIEARIWPERCSDGMSDRTWTYGATVTVDTMRYRGCADPAPGLSRALRPLGAWVIAGHRMPGISALSNEEAARMHGRTIVFDSARAVSDTAVCSDAAYRYLTVAADSMLTEFGTTPAAAGLGGTPGGFVGVTEVRCGDQPWGAPGGLLLWADDERPLTVWDGVFYELAAERTNQP